MTGKVISYSDYRGYGFVLGMDKNAYFIHVSQIKMDGHKTLNKGEGVSFTPVHGSKGFQAKELVVLEKKDVKVEPSTFCLKKNPFIPQEPVINTSKFAGRRESIINSIDALFNNKNILILGPRGIGKSSLSYQLMYLTQGKIDLLDRLAIDLGEFKFSNLVGDHRCVPGNTILDISNGLLTTFSSGVNSALDDEKRKTLIGIDLKFFKLTSELEAKKISPSDISLAFVSKIEEFIDKMPYLKKQITFVIDEVDVLDPTVDIAPFLKATSEKFKVNRKIDVSFIVSGVTGTITELISQHPSISRLFENISLPRMEHSELSEIIDSCLAGTNVKINEDAKEEIITLSNQFPQPVHLLGYHAFRLDSDDIISNTDVEAARNFIVSDIKRQDFESKFDRIAPGPTTEVIRVFAQASLETVNLNYLRVNLKHMSDEKILGTVGELMKKGFIEKQHRDVFKFHDYLFKVYLRWLFGIEHL